MKVEEVESISESIGKFTPYGLTSIDAANSLVLKSIAEKDWVGMTGNLRILAYTPGDQELNDLADAHIKETERKCESMRILGSGYVMADKFTLAGKIMAFLTERNFDLYKQLRLKMRLKGYLQTSWLPIDRKDLEKLESEEQ